VEFRNHLAVTRDLTRFSTIVFTEDAQRRNDIRARNNRSSRLLKRAVGQGQAHLSEEEH
jgi:hypothetical protein